MQAIVSVSDKRGVVEFARGLAELGATIYSTGNTQQSLTGAGVPARPVSELTGFPEILDGRVKTLHPRVHGGILARRDLASHQAELAAHEIAPIDLVVVNLYPFIQTVTAAPVTREEALEQIDIGGPTLIRAAAKNYPSVTVVVDPDDYDAVLEALRSGPVAIELRRRLAQKAFQRTALYDTAVAQYLGSEEASFPGQLTLAMRKVLDLRYGENPHQRAAFYAESSVHPAPPTSVAAARQLAGPELSFNNILDFDAALGIVTDYNAITATVIKHTNPCGLACAETLEQAYLRALAGDPVSAYGGIVGLNRPLDLTTAEAIRPTHFDGIIAPSYDEAAVNLLRRKKGLRILAYGDALAQPADGLPLLAQLDVRAVRGGFLIQTRDQLPEDAVNTHVVTERHPTLEELTDLLFAWRAVKHVKSNAIVLARKLQLVGMGAGQPNRMVSVRIAAEKADSRAIGSVLASDAFFPFADGIEVAAEAGVTAVIQPGGSIRDEEVIAAANRHQIAMVLTGTRHFRH